MLSGSPGFARDDPLFFAVEVGRLGAFHDDVIRWPKHRPLFAVRIITGVADRIVRDHVVGELVRSGVGDLVRFARSKEERIPGDTSVVPALSRTFPRPETTR